MRRKRTSARENQYPRLHVGPALGVDRIELSAESTIGDERVALTALIRTAMADSQVIVVTGGLGPTFDDLTREAAAQACGRLLIASRALLKDIQRKFRKARYRRMPPANERQADLLDGADALANKAGTARDNGFPSDEKC